jgi:hypothetical protein
MFISQIAKENGNLTKTNKKMEPFDLIHIYNSKTDEKFSKIYSLFSSLKWKSLSTSIQNPTFNYFQNSVGRSVGLPMDISTNMSAKILIRKLNAKRRYSPMGSKK